MSVCLLRVYGIIFVGEDRKTQHYDSTRRNSLIIAYLRERDTRADNLRIHAALGL